MSLLARLMRLDGSWAEGMAPQEPLAVVGDIHGRDDLLDLMLARLTPTEARIVFVGDYVDRGSGSAAVLRRLQSLCAERAGTLCLKGNHEDMMLRFLGDPQDNAGWLTYGGLETLSSFGIDGAGGAPADLAGALRAKMGAQMIDWLAALPHLFQSGNVAVSHAGADPARAITDQSDEALVWGQTGYGRMQRSDGIWVVHGHVIAARVTAQMGHINVDTGAYKTGRLSAAILRAGAFEVAEVRG